MSNELNPFEKAQALLETIKETPIEGQESLESFRIRFLGSKNEIRPLFGLMKEVANEQKKEFGQLLNSVKNAAQEKYDAHKSEGPSTAQGSGEKIDITKPAGRELLGARHPITIMRNRMVEIFSSIGYVVEEGPEIEDDWHNFTALNTPEDHPARDMQDTFYISKNPPVMLRTHTSSVQVRVMETQKPPIRMISPGRTYRNETISARAHCQFHQMEGLYIDKGVSFADLKQNLQYFAREMFGADTEIRLRPSYFPFTEPSAELDVTCLICKGKGCPVCKGTGWVEIGGCGMVDPAVLENCKIDSTVYSGFAFGWGIERSTMLNYRINDIRLLFENDIRFLKQFEGA